MVQERAAKERLQRAPAPNDHVRIKDGRSMGTIGEIEKGRVVINYDAFIVTMALDRLELVQRMK